MRRGLRAGIVVTIALGAQGLCGIGWAGDDKLKFTLSDLQKSYGNVDAKKVRDAARVVRTAGLNPDGFTMDEFNQAVQSARWMSSRSRRASSGIGGVFQNTELKHTRLHQFLGAGFTVEQDTDLHQFLDLAHQQLHFTGPIEAVHTSWHQTFDQVHGSFHNEIPRPLSDQEHGSLHQLLTAGAGGTLTEAQHTQLRQLLDTRRQQLGQDLPGLHDSLHSLMVLSFTGIPHEQFHSVLDSLEQSQTSNLDAAHELFHAP